MVTAGQYHQAMALSRTNSRSAAAIRANWCPWSRPSRTISPQARAGLSGLWLLQRSQSQSARRTWYRRLCRTWTRPAHLKALGELFLQVLKLCETAGLVKLGHVALDGTKIKANASKHKAMSYERMKKREAELKAEVACMLGPPRRRMSKRTSARQLRSRGGVELFAFELRS